MIGEKLSEVLYSIETALIEFEANVAKPPQYTDDGFRAASKIFISAMLDKMWKLQEAEGMDINDRGEMAAKLGEEIRKLVRVYTNIDTHYLYKNK